MLTRVGARPFLANGIGECSKVHGHSSNGGWGPCIRNGRRGRSCVRKLRLRKVNMSPGPGFFLPRDSEEEVSACESLSTSSWPILTLYSTQILLCGSSSERLTTEYFGTASCLSSAPVSPRSRGYGAKLASPLGSALPTCFDFNCQPPSPTSPPRPLLALTFPSNSIRPVSPRLLIVAISVVGGVLGVVAVLEC